MTFTLTSTLPAGPVRVAPRRRPGGRGGPAFRGAGLAQAPPAVALDRGDLDEQRVDVGALHLELRAAVLERLEEAQELAAVAFARVVQVEDLADLVEREAEPLPPQDQLDPRALALAVDAGLTTRLGASSPSSS